MSQENLRESLAKDDDGDSEEGGLVMSQGHSANGKLIVKLKLPKMAYEEEVAAVEEIGPVEEVKSHYCADCKKSFSSGKALGGHMSSAHVQANKDFSLKKMKFKKNQRNSWGFQWAEIICSLCGKNFPSKKSLFGHMRCHPERYWRGMDPPSEWEIDSMAASSEPMVEYNGVYQESDDFQIDSGPDVMVPMVDLTKSVKSWPVTGRRGRRAIKPVIDSPSVSSSEKKKVLEAVYQLIRLVGDDSEKFKRKFPEGESMSSDSLICQGPETDNVNRASENKNKKSDFAAPNFSEREDVDDGNIGGTNIKNNSKGKDAVLSKHEISANTTNSSSDHESLSHDEPDFKNLMNEKQFEGSNCGTSIDNKFTGKKRKTMDSKAIEGTEIKNRPMNHSKISQEFTKDNIKFTPVQEKPESPMPTSPDKYICTVCNRSFPSHQALGGHRSSHNKLKVSIHNTIDKPKNTEAVINNDQQDANSFSPNKNTSPSATIPLSFVDDDDTHLCRICNQNFPSGQALGGHKKSHWIHDFDLNETPNTQENENLSSSKDSNFF